MRQAVPTTKLSPERLIDALRDPERYPHPVERVERLETHISWVLLAGEYAYKIKKPVDLGFLDFTTLDARKRFCEEELRLNRRTAPGLYLAVVAITGSDADPQVDGAGAAVEYAVQMRRFDQAGLLDRLAKRGELTPGLVDAIARDIAEFHARVAVAAAGSAFGRPAQVTAPALANFDHIARLLGAEAGASAADARRRERLRAWAEREGERLAPVFAARQGGGFVRECHGDLHLGNIALVDGVPTAFDCIEFNPELRWIDVMSELAFLVMDLLDRRMPGAAYRCLNAYLEATGDYDGLAVLRFYLVYRAMVRAKVACIRAYQPGLAADARTATEAEYRRYFDLAERLARPGAPALVLMHGLSGSGKTTVAGDLLERIGAVRIRSDVERKRLHGLAADARTQSAVAGGIYGADATRRTYARLAEAAGSALRAGWPAIVDATFLRRAERDAFRALARECDAPFAIFSCQAPEPVLRERIVARARGGADASEADLAVLARQLAVQEPLDGDELRDTVVLDASAGPRAAADAVEALARRVGIGAQQE
ncbi:MAG: AAA family ATPase [Burkholderiales bacterium]|nr:AAA family ATPase [Burkholderiales bacterium]